MVSHRIKIGMGEGVVLRAPSVISVEALGSCVALALYDIKRRIGGIAHIMLPNSSEIRLRTLTLHPLPEGEGRGEGDSELPGLAPRSGAGRTPNSILFSPYQCADTAIATLLEELRNAGAHIQDTFAKVVGGSCMFAFDNGGRQSIGEDNIMSIMHLLKREGIPLAGKDIGGNYGRSVEFHLNSGRLIVRGIGIEERKI